MDRVISLKAAIDALGRIGSLDTYADREYATEIFMNLPSAQQWIPCSERLPEKNGEYLVTRWTGYLQKGLVIDIAKYYEGEWKKAFPVDAWMPLPEAYKGEQP